MEVHPGIEDSILYNLGTELLSEPLKSNVQTIFNKFRNINNDDLRISQLNELDKVLNGHSIKNIDELIWFYQCTGCYLLLNKLPYSLNQGMINLMRTTFQVSDEKYISSNNIHLLAKNLFNILKEEFNLVYLVRQMSSYSILAMLVGLTLIWAGIIRLFKIPFTNFKIYKIKKLNIILKNYNIEYIKRNLNIFIKFLRLEEQLNYLQIQKKYFLKYEQNKTFNTYFHVSSEDIDILKSWFEILLEHLDGTISKGMLVYSIEEQVIHVYEILNSEINILMKCLNNTET